MSLQVGDTVIIEPLVEREIQSYIFGFNSIMNDYIGYKTKITIYMTNVETGIA